MCFCKYAELINLLDLKLLHAKLVWMPLILIAKIWTWNSMVDNHLAIHYQQ